MHGLSVVATRFQRTIWDKGKQPCCCCAYSGPGQKVNKKKRRRCGWSEVRTSRGYTALLYMFCKLARCELCVGCALESRGWGGIRASCILWTPNDGRADGWMADERIWRGTTGGCHGPLGMETVTESD